MTTDFATFLAWEATFSDAFIVRRIYVRMVDDLNAGIMLSRIVYYYLPGKDGNSRLRVNHQNRLWIAKGRDEWEKEICLTPKQVDRSVKILRDLNLVDKATFKFNGTPKMHVRLRIGKFLTAWQEQLDDSESVQLLSIFPQGGKSTLPDGESPKPIEYIYNIYNIRPNLTQVASSDGGDETDGAAPSCPACGSVKIVSDEYDPKGRCAYCLLLAAWKYYFKDKPQPRHTTRSLRQKAESRWKDAHFRDNFQVALERASKSETCRTKSWFKFKFFVENDENYQNMIDNWMSWKDEEIGGLGMKQNGNRDSGMGQI
jgi:hypothetical protein